MTVRIITPTSADIEVVQGDSGSLIKKIKETKPETGDFLLVRVSGTEASRQLMRQTLKTAILLVEKASKKADAQAQLRLLEAITPGPPPVPAATARHLEMMRQARLFVRDSAEWLKASDIAQRSDRPSSNPSTMPNRWKSDKRIFAINIEGTDYFPDYGLHEGMRANSRTLTPKPIMQTLIEKLGGDRSGWQLAEWFASPNGYLHGKRPLDLLDTEPDLVEKAAEFEAKGIQHG